MTGVEDGTARVITGQPIVGRSPHGASGINSEDMAKGLGLKGRVVPNLVHFAALTEMLLDEFGEAWLRTGQVHVKYLAPLYDGETLRPMATAVASHHLGESTVVLDIWCENERGEELARGQATCRVGTPG